MKHDENSLLELTKQQFLDLSDAKAEVIAKMAGSRQANEARYAMLGMVCGTLGLLACIVAFVYLVINGHVREAYAVLGTAVLSIVAVS
ncbi:MAG: hypothetical protein ACRD3N_12265 [Terracidiphilus sp.]